MADFEYVSINTTAEKIERIANMDIDDVTLDENSTDNSLPTSKLVFDTIKNEVENKIDQTYNPESENAQSGKAVAEAVGDCVKKVTSEGQTQRVYTVTSVFGSDAVETLEVEEHALFENETHYGVIPRRQSNGNLMTNTPTKDLDCANKKYVDDLVGDIETLLGGI